VAASGGGVLSPAGQHTTNRRSLVPEVVLPQVHDYGTLVISKLRARQR